jgi:AraC-like DNA-binding protein
MTDGAPGAISPAELTPGIFTTSGLPTARRVELWESHNAAALIGLTVRAPDSLDAAELNVQLPRARLARVTGSAHAVERTRDLILRCPADSVAVFLTLRGEARFTADGVTVERRRGDALVWEADRPFTRTFARGLEELVVTIPRAELAARSELTALPSPVITSFAAPPTAGPARFGRSAGPAGATGSAGLAGPAGSGPSDQHARALARIAGRATRAEHPLRPDERTVLDLVTAIAAGPRSASGAAHRAAARSYIEEHLTDPSLGADQVAAAIGISDRQLSRVFAADGTSVPRHILSRRLRLAYSILSGGAGADQTVADVAARCGFTSVTYFSHVFRQRFGERASDIRGAGGRTHADQGLPPGL